MLARLAPPIEAVKSFWESNPLCSHAVGIPTDDPSYFAVYDRIRETHFESVAESYAIHEYKGFCGKRVLDVGCGNGYVLRHYAREGAETVGVDITQRAVDICTLRFAHENLWGSFEVANAEHLPFDDDTFDCVCSMGVLHHVPDTEQAVREIHRVLKPGGRLIVMLYHRDSAEYWFSMRLRSALQGKPIQQVVNEFDGVGNPKGDVYSKTEMAHLLRDFVGLDMFVGHLHGGMFIPRIGRTVPRSWLKPIEGKLGWCLYGKARKAA